MQLNRFFGYYILLFILKSLTVCSGESRFNLVSLIRNSPLAHQIQIPKDRFGKSKEHYRSYDLALILDLSPDPKFTFKPAFVSQSLETNYNFVHQQIHSKHNMITGFYAGSLFEFFKKTKKLLFALQALGVRRLTVYRLHEFDHEKREFDYVIYRQFKLQEHDLCGVFDYYPESYFREKKDTQYITDKLEKKPGISGSISKSE